MLAASFRSFFEGGHKDGFFTEGFFSAVAADDLRLPALSAGDGLTALVVSDSRSIALIACRLRQSSTWESCSVSHATVLLQMGQMKLSVGSLVSRDETTVVVSLIISGWEVDGVSSRREVDGVSSRFEVDGVSAPAVRLNSRIFLRKKPSGSAAPLPFTISLLLSGDQI